MYVPCLLCHIVTSMPSTFAGAEVTERPPPITSVRARCPAPLHDDGAPWGRKQHSGGGGAFWLSAFPLPPAGRGCPFWAHVLCDRVGVCQQPHIAETRPSAIEAVLRCCPLQRAVITEVSCCRRAICFQFGGQGSVQHLYLGPFLISSPGLSVISHVYLGACM